METISEAGMSEIRKEHLFDVSKLESYLESQINGQSNYSIRLIFFRWNIQETNHYKTIQIWTIKSHFFYKGSIYLSNLFRIQMEENMFSEKNLLENFCNQLI